MERQRVSTWSAMAVVLAFTGGSPYLLGQESMSETAGALLQAHRQQNAGENSAARTILVKALFKEPASAVLLDALGSVQQDLGEYQGAEESYLRALRASGRTTGDMEHILILNNLGTLYLDTQQYSKAEWVRAELEKMPFRALESHPAEAARLLNVLGCLEHARNRDENAVRYYEQALALFRKTEGPVSADAAAVESNFGSLRLELGQYQAAKDFFRRSIQEIESAVGTDNAALVQPLVNLARCETLTGDWNGAEILARRAVEISDRIFGGQHPITVAAMLEQACALRKLGRKGEARRLEKQANASLRSASAAGLPRYTIGFRELAKKSSR